MELRQLKYFMVICEELHFTRAAEKLNISQPSLSQHIQNLEAAIGTPLFDRIGRSIAITEAGKILLKHCHRIFHELDQAKLRIHDLNGLRRGELKIGSLQTSAQYLLPEVILKFNRLYPQVKLSVLSMSAHEIKQQILENTIDLGISFLPAEHEEVESVSLTTEELALAIPKGHPLENEAKVSFDVLAEISTVMFPSSYYLRELIDAYSLQKGFSLKPTVEMTTLETMLLMVEKGIGATVLPLTYLQHMNNPHIKVVQLTDPTPMRSLGIMYRKDKFMCAATKVFIDEIKNNQSSLQIKQEAN